MPNSLSILFIEDSKNDCDLLAAHFREKGFQPTYKIVESAPEMHEALANNGFDIILCDHSLPNFDIFSALAVAKLKAPHVPFIVVSGTVSEEAAVSSVKSGAKDYILKSNLSRLVPAVARELSEVKKNSLLLIAEAELKRKDVELRQASKLEAIGHLTGGIAHDFNNILAVIIMQTEKSMDYISRKSELKDVGAHIQKSLEQILKSGNRAANLTRQLMAFSRKQVILPKVLNINEVILEMQKMFSHVIEENISLELQLDQTCKNIKVDPGHIEQILMNLIVNSRDAIANGGKITISTENCILNTEQSGRMNVCAGHYTLLQVADTGSGMSEETQKHVFDPFFTTKEVGKGTGLGLSTVYGIVKQNGGSISVESKLKVGSTFKIYFPQAGDILPEILPVVVKESQARGTETILVVEDEKDLRELVCETLKSSGYNVLEARDGVEGLSYFKNSQKTIHLVLTDVIMPAMGGHELSEQVKTLNGKTKFLFLSGYTQNISLNREISTDQAYFLEKPYTLKALLNKIRNILAEGHVNAL